jgi:hypothetical protein
VCAVLRHQPEDFDDSVQVIGIRTKESKRGSRNRRIQVFQYEPKTSPSRLIFI